MPRASINRMRNPSCWSESSNDTSFSRAYTASADLVSVGSTRDTQEARIGSEFVTEILDFWKKNRDVRGSILEKRPLADSRTTPVVIIGEILACFENQITKPIFMHLIHLLTGVKCRHWMDRPSLG
eukprot:2389499-Rhodomonas_salina.1